MAIKRYDCTCKLARIEKTDKVFSVVFGNKNTNYFIQLLLRYMLCDAVFVKKQLTKTGYSTETQLKNFTFLHKCF